MNQDTIPHCRQPRMIARIVVRARTYHLFRHDAFLEDGADLIRRFENPWYCLNRVAKDLSRRPDNQLVPIVQMMVDLTDVRYRMQSQVERMRARQLV